VIVACIVLYNTAVWRTDGRPGHG